MPWPGSWRAVSSRWVARRLRRGREGAVRGLAFRVDLAYAEKRGSGFARNIVVIRETPGGKGLSEIEDRELDGTPAKTYSYQRREKENGKVRQRQVVAVSGDAIYIITWSVAADDFEAQQATLDAILDSWRWS